MEAQGVRRIISSALPAPCELMAIYVGTPSDTRGGDMETPELSLAGISRGGMIGRPAQDRRLGRIEERGSMHHPSHRGCCRERPFAPSAAAQCGTQSSLVAREPIPGLTLREFVGIPARQLKTLSR